MLYGNVKRPVVHGLDLNGYIETVYRLPTIVEIDDEGIIGRSFGEDDVCFSGTMVTGFGGKPYLGFGVLGHTGRERQRDERADD